MRAAAWLIDLAGAPFRLGVARGIRVEAIRVALAAAGENREVSVRYEFGGDSTARGRAVGLGLWPCPLEILAIESDECRASWPKMRPFGRRRTVVCELRPGKQWNGATIRVHLRWVRPPADPTRPAVLVLPDMLPVVLNAHFDLERRVQPPLFIEGIEHFAFVRFRRQEPDAYCGVLVHDMPGDVSVALGSTGQQALLGGSVIALDGAYRDQLVQLLARSYTFLAAELKCALDVRLLATGGSNYRNGASALLQESVSRGMPLSPQVVYARVGRDMAAHWWGTACRILGKHDEVLLAGICEALALRWTESVAPAGAAELVDFYDRLDASSKTAPLVRATVRVGTALFRRMSRDDSLMDTLRELTEEHLGFSVPAATILARVARQGMRLV